MTAAVALPQPPHCDLALDEGQRGWSRSELDAQVAAFSARLQAAQVQVLASLLDNSAAWVVADLALADAGRVHVPLPVFLPRPRSAMRWRRRVVMPC